MLKTKNGGYLFKTPSLDVTIAITLVDYKIGHVDNFR